MIPADLIEILRCPQTGQPLNAVTSDELAKLNTRITRVAGSEVCNQTGERITTPLECGLIRSDGLAIYPVREGIAVLLVSEAIPLPSL